MAHDRDNNRAVAQDTSRADAQSAVDPWALPEAGAGDAWSPTDDASHNVSRDVSRNAPQDEGHHAKHIAVPDLSDDTDPWANDGGNSMPVDGVRGGDAPGTPQNVAHAQSQSRAHQPWPHRRAGVHVRGRPLGWHAVISRFRFVEHRRAKRRLPGSSPRAFRRLGCARAPGKPRSRTGNDASAADSRCRSRSESIPPCV